LGNCITALVNMQKFEGNKVMLQRHIPYRESKLTRVLKDTLVDPLSHILLIINLHPSASYYDETFNSLAFADKIKKIKPELLSETEKPFFYKPKTTPLFNPELATLNKQFSMP